MPRQANYLFKQGQSYYFQFRVNKHRAIKKSLGKISYHEARGIAFELAGIIKNHMADKYKQGLIETFISGKPVKIEQENAEEERKTLELLLKSQHPALHEPEKPEVNWGEVVSSYLKSNADNWQKSSRMEFDAALNLWLEITKDRQQSYETADHYLETLKKLPTKLKQRKVCQGKSITEILDIPDLPLRSATTIKKDLSTVKTFMSWAVRRGHVDQNYYTGLQVKEVKKAREKRLPFTQADIDQIFDNLPELNNKEPWKHWLPILGYYTGARIEELCQLTTGDIQQDADAGVWFINITDEDEKSVKNVSSVRKVPVHSALEKSLREWLETLPTGRIFPKLEADDKGRLSNKPSKWFGRFKNKHLPDPEQKAFHSFRHTIVERLKHAGVDDKLIGAILGHTDTSMTTGLYGSGERPLEQIKTALDKLPRLTDEKRS